MSGIIPPRNKQYKPLSTQLRNHATEEESLLWFSYLRNYPIQFNRQRIIGTYIADFYCRKADLVIELDGSQHYEEAAVEYDEERTKFLNSIGIEVLRIPNNEVRKNLSGVCELIDSAVKSRMNR